MKNKRGPTTMKIAISTESTVDLTPELIKKYDVNIVPFTVTLGDESAPDGDITPQKIYAYVDKTGKLPRTSAVNQYQYEQHFRKLKEEGYDQIVHVTLSSGISVANQNAVIASQKFEGVYVVDSKSLSTGIALLVIYARELVEKGFNGAAIKEKLEKRVPYVQASFVLDTVEYLYKGGRCNSLTRLAVNVFKIRPQIIVTDGKMISGRKYRGKDAPVVTKYCEDTLELFANADKSVAFVTATSYEDEIFALAEQKLKDAGFKTIYRTTAGATITSHCGPKTIGILYINDGGAK